MQAEQIQKLKEKLLAKIEELKLAFNLQNINAAKIKEFATSNKGIKVIVVIIFCVLMGLHFHKNKTPENRAADWNASVASDDTSLINNQPINEKPGLKSTPTEVEMLKKEVENLKQSLTETNERVMALTQQLLAEKKEKVSKQAEKKPYLLLGVHLSEASNQWVADVQYENMVVSVLSGEKFGGWQVKEVNAQGAIIE